MKKLLNTLYITSPDKYLALDGENVVVLYENKEAVRFPLHGLEAIVTSGYTGASPALMGACAKRDISLCFMTQNGKFLLSQYLTGLYISGIEHLFLFLSDHWFPVLLIFYSFCSR